MSLPWIALVAIALLGLSYRWYGARLARWFDLSPARPTPAHVLGDGVDYVPAKTPFLLAQHVSAIAAAGPIVGPILAGLAFGWLPTLLWIVLGTIFIGALHDFSSLVSSVRHRGCSIVKIVQEQLGPRAHLLFLGFVWLSLVYVITAFSDLTSASFAEPLDGGGVASASVWYLGLALAMGVTLRVLRAPLWAMTLVGVPLLGVIIWWAPELPIVLPPVGPLSAQGAWNVVILTYCLAASALPVWLLLQPRGYLGGIFLYLVLIGGTVGLFLGGDAVRYPAFLGWMSRHGQPLFPLLFVTVACGACSGFHGLVSSGTTSRQINREPDCRAVGYGGMLLEGVVAVIALATVMLLAPSDPAVQQSPDRIYANGLSQLISRFGLPYNLVRTFVLLAFATFIFDTLDVATRLGRYVLQELTGWRGPVGRLGATVATLALPAACVSLTMPDAAGRILPAWKLFWTVFGTSNQLLAALTLLTVTVWLRRMGRPWLMSALPAAFVLTMTLWSLGLMIQPWVSELSRGRLAMNWIAGVAAVLLGLAVLIVWEVRQAFSASGSMGRPRAQEQLEGS
jgi:carbon starvation protein